MMRKLKSGKPRLSSPNNDMWSSGRRNFGAFGARETAAKHEQEIRCFKHKVGDKPTKAQQEARRKNIKKAQEANRRD